MPRLSRVQRLIGLLQQMLDTVRSRTVPIPRTTENTDEVAIRQQRRHIEWLCDHDINAFRIYTHADMVDTRVLPLSALPRTLTWGYQNQDRDTLYYGSQPFIFYVPASITFLTFEEEQIGQHRFELELTPLALQDIVALDHLAAYARPNDYDYPRRVFISTTLVNEDAFVIFDVSSGSMDGDICWSDVFVDDYLLAEVQVTRVFDTEQTWRLRYKLIDATRLATND